MPTYKVTAPNGKVYNVNAPANAKPEEIYGYVESLMQQEALRPKAPEPVITEEPQKPAGVMGRVKDFGVGLGQGVVGLGQGLVGIADIPSGGAVGNALEQSGVDLAGAQEYLQTLKSPEQQQAEQNVANAEGFADTIKAGIKNPSAVTNLIANSLPSMVGGAGIARGVLGAAAKSSPMLAAGLGEGAVTAGGMAEDIRHKTGDLSAGQAALSATAGVLTGALGAFGGKVAQKLGVADPDVWLASGMNAAKKGSALKGAIKGALAESTFEELPQSMQEQITQNLAMDRPWDEGVAEAGAQGVLAGAPVGGAVAGIGQRTKNKEADALQREQEAQAAKVTQQVATERAARQAEIDRLTQNNALNEAYSAVDQADEEGGRAILDELSNQETQSKQELANVLNDLKRKKEEPSVNDLLRTPEGINEVLKNPQDYFPDFDTYSQADKNTLKSDLRNLRSQLTPKEPTKAELRNQRKDDLTEAFAMPEDQSKYSFAQLVMLGVTPESARTLQNKNLTAKTNAARLMQLTESNDKKEAKAAEALYTRLFPEVIEMPTVEDEETIPLTQEQQDVVNQINQAPSEEPKTKPTGTSVKAQFNALNPEIPFEKLSRSIREAVSELHKSGTPIDEVMVKYAMDEAQRDVPTAQQETVQPEQAAVEDTTEEQAPMELAPINEFDDIDTEADYNDDLSDYSPQDRFFEKRGEPTRKPAKNTPAKTDDVLKEFQKITTPQGFATRPPHVVATADELPAHLREAISDKTQAFVDPSTGQDYYIADRMPAKDIRGVIMHERGVHIGMAKLLGRGRVRALTNRVLDWATDGKTKPENKAATKAIARADASGAKGEVYEEEILAYFTDILVNEYGIDPMKQQPKELSALANWLRDLYAGIVKALGKLRLAPQQLTGKDVVNIVYGAARIASRQAATPTAQNYKERAPTTTESVRDDIDSMGKLYNKNPVRPVQTPTEVTKQVARDLIANPSQTIHGFISEMVTKGQVRWSSRQAAVSKALQDQYQGNIRAAFDQVRGDVLLDGVDNVSYLTDGVFTYGGVELVDGVPRASASDTSIDGVFAAAKKLADRVGKAEARELINGTFYLWRAKALKQMDSEYWPVNWQHDAKLIPTDAQIAAGVALFDKHPELAEMRKQFIGSKNSAVQFLHDTGFLTKEKTEQYLADDSYSPWYRIMEHEDKMKGLGNIGRSVNLSQMKKLKGGEEEVNDMLENMAQFVAWGVRSGAANNAANAALNQLSTMEKSRKFKSRPQGVADASVVMTYEDGKPVFWVVDDPLMASAFMSIQVPQRYFSTVVTKMANFLRGAIVLFPLFPVAQVINDTQRAFVLSGVKNPWSLSKQIMTAFISGEAYKGTSDTAQTLKQFGVAGDIDFNINDETRGRGDKFGLNETKGFMHGFKNSSYYKALHRLSYSADLAVRMGIYKQTMAETGDKQLAVHRAREIINFRKSGTSPFLMTMKQMVPFLGVYMQSMDVLAKAMTGRGLAMTDRKAAAHQFWTNMAMLAGMSMLYALGMSGDDDYEDKKGYVTDMNYLIPGTDIMLPVPRELGFLYKVIPERLVDYFKDNATDSPESFQRLINDTISNAWDAYKPPTTMPGVTPALETSINYNLFTDMPIVGRAYENLEPSQQFNGSTTELAKSVGSTLGYSPMKIDHILKALSGTWGAFALMGTDQMMNPEKTAPARWAGWSRFSKPEVGGRDVEEYYALRELYTRADQTFKHLQDSGDYEAAAEYMNKPETMAALSMKGIVGSLQKTITAFRQQKAFIENSSMPGDEKRAAMDELDKQLNEIMQMVNVKGLRKMAEEGM